MDAPDLLPRPGLVAVHEGGAEEVAAALRPVPLRRRGVHVAYDVIVVDN